MPEGTEVAVYVREKSDGTNKVSLRSAGKIKVSDIAIELGGGGHPRAAGYTMKEKLEVAKKKLLSMLEVMLNDR
ncbi:Bifunctional oligoribonuclease and PAP phosphatase NrnA [compost metagenome]